MLEIARTNSENVDFRDLVRSLDQELSVRDGDEYAFYAQFNKIDLIHNAVVAYETSIPIGCGAFKPYKTGVVEVKRMFVTPEQRGKGIAVEILKILENWAIELNYVSAILETGLKQPEAIRLYEKSGYERIPNYGQYAGIENSVCMNKRLVNHL